MILEELKKKGFQVRGHYNKNELDRLANDCGICLTYEFYCKDEGWLYKPKGSLQILYERGFIDERNLSKYSNQGKTNQLDGQGNVKAEHKKYVLKHLLDSCPDFVEEMSAMEYLFTKLSFKGTQSMKMLTSPKYQCELARGE